MSVKRSWTGKEGAMQVNPQQLQDDGFIILQHVIPPERLAALRASYETVVQRQHQICSGALDWDVPVAMDYEAKQPRVVLWVVPGSHRRANTVAEDRQLAEQLQYAAAAGDPPGLSRVRRR